MAERKIGARNIEKVMNLKARPSEEKNTSKKMNKKMNGQGIKTIRSQMTIKSHSLRQIRASDT